MGDFFVKRGDTGRDLQVALEDGDGAPLDLTGATVEMRAQLLYQPGAPLIVRACTIVEPPTAGLVKYAFADADWDTEQAAHLAGGLVYALEFRVTLNGGVKLTVPTEGQQTLAVVADLAAAPAP